MNISPPVKLTYSSVEWSILEQNARNNGYSDFKAQLRKELTIFTSMECTTLVNSSISSLVYPVPADVMGVIKRLSVNTGWPYAKCIKRFITDPVITKHILKYGL